MLKKIVIFLIPFFLFSCGFLKFISYDDALNMDKNPPEDVKKFEIIPYDEKIVLIWENPDNIDLNSLEVTYYNRDNSSDSGKIILDKNYASCVINNLINGSRYYAEVKTLDNAGNKSSGIGEEAIPYGTNTAIIVNPPKPFSSESSPLFFISINNLTEYKYRLDTTDDGAWITINDAKNNPTISCSGLNDNLHRIQILGYDGKTWQNDQHPTQYIWTIDTIPPTMPVINDLTDDAVYSESQAASISGETNAKIEYSYDGGASWLIYTEFLDIKIPATDSVLTKNLIVRQTDRAGNISPQKSITFQIAGNMTVAYNSQGGTAAGVKIVPYNSKAPEPANIVKTGHSLDGWYKEISYINKWNFNTDLVNSAITLYAKWIANPHTLTYHDNGSTGGSVPPLSNHNYGSQVVVAGNPNNLIKKGYTLAGWNTRSDGTGTNYTLSSGSFTMGDKDILLYAKWNINQYKITYYGNGNTAGTVPAGGQYNYGTSVTVASKSQELIKTVNGISCLFKGWNTLANGSGTMYQPGATVVIGEADIKLYAIWSIIGGTGPGGGTVFYDKGNSNNGWQYLEAAGKIVYNRLTTFGWGAGGVKTDASGDAVGTGAANSLAIYHVDKTASIAANLCLSHSVTVNGKTFTNWYLPSKNDLITYYDNVLKYKKEPVNTYYWSSTEVITIAFPKPAIYEAFAVEMYSGLATTKSRSTLCYVIPVRQF